MAEIPVEHKPAMPVWAGLLGLLALMILIWILFTLGSNARTDTDARPAETETVAAYDDALATRESDIQSGRKADDLLPS